LRTFKGGQDKLPPPDKGWLVPQRETTLPSTEPRELIHEWEEEIDIRHYLDILIRRKWIVIAVLLAVFTLVAFQTFTATPLFRAHGTLRASLQPLRLTKFEDVQSSYHNYRIDYLKSVQQLLKSEKLAARVVADLGLAQKQSNKNKATAKKEESSGSVFASIQDYIRPENEQKNKKKSTMEKTDKLRASSRISMIRGGLGIAPIEDTDIIRISYVSSNPRFASMVVNSAMEEFINMQIDSKLESTKLAASFLEKQIESARIKLEKSEQNLNAYARQAGIISLNSKQNQILSELEELTASLAKARSDRISREASYNQAMGEEGENYSLIMNNPLIQGLKAQRATTMTEYQDLSTVFKPGYPKMKQLKAKLDDIDRQIKEAGKKVLSSIKNDYEAALKKEQFLEQRLEEQKKLVIDLNERATQYNIYAREVDTNRLIYNSLLQRSKEIEASAGMDFVNTEIIDTANVPRFPFKPQIFKNIFLAVVAGLFMGLLAAFALEFMDNTIKNPDELATRYNIPVLGMIPFDRTGNETDMEVAHKFYSQPRSPLSEAIRTIMVSVELSAAEKPPQTILLTSVLPGEGKSTCSINLSLSYLNPGAKTLLVDVDLRKPGLHKLFKIVDKHKGLTNYLSGTCELHDVIQKTEFDGLDVITSGPLPPHPAELIASLRMRSFLSNALEKYDYVILDGPPFQGFAEVLILGNMVDGLILVSELGKTPREGLRHFKKSFTNVGGYILGGIINRAEKGKGYGYYKYSGYKYYTYEYGKESKALT
jgi:capsular exopolysaccharide synthesis family protein